MPRKGEAPAAFREGKLQKKDFRSRTPEEMKEIQRRATEAKRERAKRRRAMREQLQMLLKMDATETEQIAELKSMGLEDEDICNQMVLMVALFKRGARGDVAAIKQIDEMTNGILPQQSQPIVIKVNSASGVEAKGENLRTSNPGSHHPGAIKVTGDRSTVMIKPDDEEDEWSKREEE